MFSTLDFLEVIRECSARSYTTVNNLSTSIYPLTAESDELFKHR